METEGLALICAGLGIAEEDDDGNRIGYSKDELCLENLKDLVRFLRRDDPQTRLVFKQVCKWNIVSKDLIPMFKYCQEDHDLVLNAVKVLVFLTMPIDQSSDDTALQLEYLWGLKSAITRSETVVVTMFLLEGPLENLERESLTEDDWKLIQLVLTLFRNILAIQDMSLHQRVGGSALEFILLRDEFLELLFNENVMDLFLVLTQHVCGSRGFLRHDNLLLLEVFHYIFMGQDPDLIAKARFKDSMVSGGGIMHAENLKSIMDVEKQKLKQCRAQNIARHSQFSGTFSRITMDGSRTVCKVKPGAASDNLLRHHAIQRGPSKKIAWDHEKFSVTKDKILELLHDFMKQFLSGSYNVLVKSIREDIEKEQIAVQKSDIILFFQVAQFATSFQYYTLLNSKPETAKDSPQASGAHGDSTLFTGDVCGPIAESMKESMFLMVISTWREAFDALKQTHQYKLLSAAGSLMKIMIRILDLVLKVLPENSKEPQTAHILLYKLFYDQTDQGMTQFLLNLIKSFNAHKQSKSDLADLVETVHVIVRLMGTLQTRGTMRVSKGSRKARKKKSSNQKGAGDLPSGGEATTQDKNEELPDSSNVEKGSQENEIYNQQDGIDTAIPADKPEISLGTGNLDSSPQPNNRNEHMDDDLSSCSDEESADDQSVSNYEVDFNVSTFMKSFANHSIISNLCWLLKFYKNNSVGTNHYIISMLRRITDDLDLAPMLYQLSLLTTFYDILNEQKSRQCKEYENMVDFLTTLVRRMLRKMKNQPLLFLEVLFWKSRTECQYINTDYLVHELGSLRRKTRAFDGTEDGEVGSVTGWAPRSIADALGEDEADVVISHDVGDQQMEEGSNELQKEMASTSGSSFLRKEDSNHGHRHERFPKKRRLVLTREIEIKIKDLYEEFKGDEKCCHRIAESLDPTGGVSPTQVFNKLKQLGLKASLKKRVRTASGVSDSTNAEGGKITGGGLQKQSAGLKKRAPAIGKDQEDKIRDLYEQFKGEKKCNHMIASALSPEGRFTAAQVSRKLKQLGLLVLWKKRTQTDTNVGDEGFDDGHESDDETLLSFKERRVRDAQERKRSRKSTPQVSAQKEAMSSAGGRAAEDSSPEAGVSLANDDDDQLMMGDDMGGDDMGADDDGGSEPEDDDGMEVSPSVKEDELEDDDVEASPTNGDVGGSSVHQMRRKSRMVIDDEDE